jgi:hypothetical protein
LLSFFTSSIFSVVFGFSSSIEAHLSCESSLHDLLSSSADPAEPSSSVAHEPLSAERAEFYSFSFDVRILSSPTIVSLSCEKFDEESEQ